MSLSFEFIHPGAALRRRNDLGDKVVVVEGCHHMVSMERPDATVKEIVGFLL